MNWFKRVAPSTPAPFQPLTRGMTIPEATEQLGAAKVFYTPLPAHVAKVLEARGHGSPGPRVWADEPVRVPIPGTVELVGHRVTLVTPDVCVALLGMAEDVPSVLRHGYLQVVEALAPWAPGAKVAGTTALSREWLVNDGLPDEATQVLLDLDDPGARRAWATVVRENLHGVHFTEARVKDRFSPRHHRARQEDPSLYGRWPNVWNDQHDWRVVSVNTRERPVTYEPVVEAGFWVDKSPRCLLPAEVDVDY